jgi:hypothetical protein
LILKELILALLDMPIMDGTNWNHLKNSVEGISVHVVINRVFSFPAKLVFVPCKGKEKA